MFCPNCNSENIQKDICLDCATDILIYNDINNIANSLYNNGLENIYDNNLTEALENLKNSLVSNKKHIESRNLIGLLYMEMGLIYKGIREFKTSLKLKPNDNLATDYLKTINSNAKRMEELEESQKIFNQGLVYINQSSDDMAVIQLKKAIDLNGKFLDAYNLLAVCYMYQEKNDLALEMVNKVLGMDSGNKKALHYKKMLGGSKIAVINSKKDTEKVSKTSKIIPIFNYQEDNRQGLFRGFGMYNFIYIIIGLIVGIAIFYILIIPEMTNSNKKLIEASQDEANILREENVLLLEENTTTITDLENTKKDLEMRNKELEERVSIQDRIQNLNNASDLINKGDYEEASILLNSFDENGLEDELIDKYNELVEKSHPRTANILYQRGVSKYRARDYDEADASFKECLKYASEESSQYGDSLYFLGEIALINDDEVLANKYFETVVNDYKNIAKNYWSARNRIQ